MSGVWHAWDIADPEAVRADGEPAPGWGRYAPAEEPMAGHVQSSVDIIRIQSILIFRSSCPIGPRFGRTFRYSIPPHHRPLLTSTDISTPRPSLQPPKMADKPM